MDNPDETRPLLIRYHQGKVRATFDSTAIIACFDSGADTRTRIAMMQSVTDERIDDNSEVPTTKALAAKTNNSYTTIDPDLHASYESYIRDTTTCSFDHIRLVRIRKEREVETYPSGKRHFDKRVFLDRILRTAPSPLNSPETLLLLAACAVAVVHYDSIGLAFKCLQAIFIHNNRRYDLKMQRQHKKYEDSLLDKFNDGSIAEACKRFEKRYYDWEDSDDEEEEKEDDDEEEDNDNDGNENDDE